jgi:hypothetical protein
LSRSHIHPRKRGSSFQASGRPPGSPHEHPPVQAPSSTNAPLCRPDPTGTLTALAERSSMSGSLTWLIGLGPRPSSTIPAKKPAFTANLYAHRGTRLRSNVGGIEEGATDNFCVSHRTVHQDEDPVTDSPWGTIASQLEPIPYVGLDLACGSQRIAYLLLSHGPLRSSLKEPYPRSTRALRSARKGLRN